MGTVRRFEDLDVWQTARQLANHIYDCTSTGPFAKDFGLRDQIQRAAVSVMSNIAEGVNNRTQRIFIDLLGRARGSAAEVQSQLYLAQDQGYIADKQMQEGYNLAGRAARQIYTFIRYLESNPNAGRAEENTIIYKIDL
jgi:four helix bundle protein